MVTRRKKPKYFPKKVPVIKHELLSDESRGRIFKIYGCKLCKRKINHRECSFCWETNKKNTREKFGSRYICQKENIGVKNEE